MTFDDGVDSVLTPQVLDVLDRYGAKATFCIIGEKAVANPEMIKVIIGRGHTIVNHSMYHKGSFPMLVKYFRAPFGVTNPMVGRAVRRAGLQSIGWSIRSFDTMGHSVEVVEKRVTSQIKGGDIILLHDNRECVVELTERILIFIRDNGYKAVSIDRLLHNQHE